MKNQRKPRLPTRNPEFSKLHLAFVHLSGENPDEA
jgi:hypothetical protein